MIVTDRYNFYKKIIGLYGSPEEILIVLRQEI